MTILSDFIDDLVIAVPNTPINALVAQPGADGRAVAVSVSDAYADLGLGGCRTSTPTTIQLDVYDSSYLRLSTTKDLIIDRYHGVTLTLGTTTFKRMFVTFSAESATTTNNTVYRAIITLEART